jgi:hypothetical protein
MLTWLRRALLVVVAVACFAVMLMASASAFDRRLGGALGAVAVAALLAGFSANQSVSRLGGGIATMLIVAAFGLVLLMSGTVAWVMGDV